MVNIRQIFRPVIEPTARFSSIDSVCVLMVVVYFFILHHIEYGTFSLAPPTENALGHWW